MDKIEKIRQEIERLKSTNPSEYNYQNAVGYTWALDDLLSFIDTLEEEPDKSLEEAAHLFSESPEPLYSPGHRFHWDDDALFGKQIEASFIAGAEWQKEQDQPITGNSLEQEWLRYVDKEKKENGGELPSLGEYGWLRIARHFAEWQKKQIPMPEDTVLFQKGVEEGKRLMMEEAVEYEVMDFSSSLETHPHVNIPLDNKKYRSGDMVRLIVLPKEDKK